MEKNRKAQKMKWTIVCYAQYGEIFQPYNLALVLLLSKLFCFDFYLPFRDMSVRPPKHREYCNYRSEDGFCFNRLYVSFVLVYEQSLFRLVRRE